MIINSPENKALILLAKRINPTNTNWYSATDQNGKVLDAFFFRCCICNEVKDGSQAMVEHSLNHLKQSGLMVFI